VLQGKSQGEVSSILITIPSSGLDRSPHLTSSFIPHDLGDQVIELPSTRGEE